MSNAILRSTVLISLTLGCASTASAKEGWYAGFGIGSNKIDLDTPAIDALAGSGPFAPGDISNTTFNGFDDNRVGFVFNGGYRMNPNVALNFDFSATYADLRIGYSNNTVVPSTNNSSEIDITSYFLTPGVNLIYPINNEFEVYAKLGLSFILTDIDAIDTYSDQVLNAPETVLSTSIKDWDIAPTIGFGGQWNFGKNWAATFEYTITQFELQPISGTFVAYNGIDYETQNILVGMRYQFD